LLLKKYKMPCTNFVALPSIGFYNIFSNIVLYHPQN
jgi:hypothetical protein